MHTLAFFQPGHFHAALTLRVANARVPNTVHLYVQSDDDRDAFLGLVNAFATRADNPVQWNVVVHQANNHDELLAQLIKEQAGNSVVLAGRNNTKLDTIAALHRAGINVLADKPWATDIRALPLIDEVTQGRTLALDIMTNRFDTVAQLRQRLVANQDVFGPFRRDGAPAIDIGSLHHLVKVVNGQVLRRPSWYFDVGVQGDGVVDIQSHMVDQVQWLLDSQAMTNGSDAGLGTESWSFDNDVRELRATRWPTAVPLSLYSQATGLDDFAADIRAKVVDGVLPLMCNGLIEYELHGVRVRQRAEWAQVEPKGGGDLHDTQLRGERANIIIRQNAETSYRPEVHVQPRPGQAGVEAALRACANDLQTEFPGIGVAESPLGFELTVPSELRTGHETHFAMVLESYLDFLDANEWPDALNERIRMRYQLLANAQSIATDVPDAPALLSPEDDA